MEVAKLAPFSKRRKNRDPGKNTHYLFDLSPSQSPEGILWTNSSGVPWNFADDGIGGHRALRTGADPEASTAVNPS